MCIASSMQIIIVHMIVVPLYEEDGVLQRQNQSNVPVGEEIIANMMKWSEPGVLNSVYSEDWYDLIPKLCTLCMRKCIFVSYYLHENI